MGCFYINVTIRQIADRSKSAVVDKMLVDTGSEATWVPRRILEQLGITPEKKPKKCVEQNNQEAKDKESERKTI